MGSSPSVRRTSVLEKPPIFVVGVKVGTLQVSRGDAMLLQVRRMGQMPIGTDKLTHSVEVAGVATNRLQTMLRTSSNDLIGSHHPRDRYKHERISIVDNYCRWFRRLGRDRK
jgi:hypothetical protein